eukprot:5392909-Prymnesium_polylepis.1
MHRALRHGRGAAQERSRTRTDCPECETYCFATLKNAMHLECVSKNAHGTESGPAPPRFRLHTSVPIPHPCTALRARNATSPQGALLKLSVERASDLSGAAQPARNPNTRSLLLAFSIDYPVSAIHARR